MFTHFSVWDFLIFEMLVGVHVLRVFMVVFACTTDSQPRDTFSSQVYCGFFARATDNQPRDTFSTQVCLF